MKILLDTHTFIGWDSQHLRVADRHIQSAVVAMQAARIQNRLKNEATR